MKKILIVDDSASIRKAVELELRSGGYDVVSTSNFDECLAAYENNSFDLIILDIEMPGKGGFETFEAIQNTKTYKIKAFYPNIALN